MRTIWQSLAWREWHEHKWKLVAITAVIWGVAVFVLATGAKEKLESISLLLPVLQVCVVPFAVFVGLGIAASERSRGTFAFTQSLPVSMWQVAIAKVVWGFLSLAIPILLTVAIVYLCKLSPAMGEDYRHPTVAARQHSVTGDLVVDVTLFSTALAASFFIWAAAFGVNRRDEVSAGVVAITAMVGWYMLLTVVWYLMSGTSPLRVTELTGETAMVVFKLMAATGPGGFMASVDAVSGERSYALMAGAGTVALLMHSLLLARYVTRFAQATNMEVVSPKTAKQESTVLPCLAKPFASTIGAIAWKQCRESLPLLAVGFAGLVGFVFLYVLQGLVHSMWTASEFAEVVVGTSLAFGFFVAVVLGIGVCWNDVGPGINTFWRSRPINADVWFWTKFLTGLLVLLSAEYIPMLMIVIAFHPFPQSVVDHYHLALCLIIQIAVFATAVMTTSLVRHAVYAAILSLAVVYLGVLCGLGLWYAAGLMGWVRLYPHGWMEPEDNLPVALGMILSAVVSTVIAWLAVRNDWGWKSRY